MGGAGRRGLSHPTEKHAGTSTSFSHQWLDTMWPESPGGWVQAEGLFMDPLDSPVGLPASHSPVTSLLRCKAPLAPTKCPVCFSIPGGVEGGSTLHGGKVASCGPTERDRAKSMVAATPAWDWAQRATVGKVPLMPEGWPGARERKSKAGRGACSCVSDSQGSRSRRQNARAQGCSSVLGSWAPGLD